MGNWMRQCSDYGVRDVPRTPLVIVDGVHAAAQCCGAFLDIIVFASTTPQVRWERMLARGQNDPEQIRCWLAAEDWCFNQQGVPGTADWIFPGDATNSGLILTISRAGSNRHPRRHQRIGRNHHHSCGSALGSKPCRGISR